MVLWILILLTGFMGIYLIGGWIRKKIQCTRKVKATISDVEYNRGSMLRKDVRHYYPVYRFVMDGQEYVVRPKEPERTNRWEKGSEVILMVNKNDPDVFREGDEKSDLIYGIIAILLCVLFIFVFLV